MSDRKTNIMGAFGEDDAVRLSGVSKSQLRLWDQSGLLPASFSPENRRQPYSRVYSFRDLVSLRVLNRLRNEFGVSSQHLRDVAEGLANFGADKWIAKTLYVLGKRVVFDDPETHQRRDIVNHQRVFDIPLKAAVSDTLSAIREDNERRRDKVGHVVRNKFVQNNQQVFEGTRVTVDAVRRYLERGRSEDEILSEFPDLTLDDIRQARTLKHNSAA